MRLPQTRVVRDVGERGSTAYRTAPKNLRLSPREVPARLVWLLLFGGQIGFFGWLFAAFGMIFVLVFVPRAHVPIVSYDRGAVGEITKVEPTSNHENERTIHRVHYEFTDERSVLRNGVGYSVDPPSVGARRRVDYEGRDPALSALEGTREKPFDWSVIPLVALFPIVGLGFAGPQLRRGLRKLRALRYGVETLGKLVQKNEMNMSINERTIMALTFEYEVDGVKYRATEKVLDTSTLEDDPLERMLYDPRDPTLATTLDNLPGSPTITSDDEIAWKPSVAFHVLLLPAIFAVELVVFVGTIIFGVKLF